MISAWLSGLGAGVEGFTAFLKSVLTQVITIFYTAGSGSDPGALTEFGAIAACALGIGFIFMALRWLTKLLKFNF
jgi:hypothetical protein